MAVYVNCVIILFAITKGGVYILSVNTITKDTKFYINEYGIFHEGQILEQYFGIEERKYYNQDVVIDKFIVHFKPGRDITLYFRISNFINKEKNVLPVNLLGTNYKIKKIKNF